MKAIFGLGPQLRLLVLAIALLQLVAASALAEPPSREAAFQATPKPWTWLAPIGPYWPDRALRAGQGGYAVVDCAVDDKSALSGCKIVAQAPADLAFGDALVMMAHRGVMSAGPAPVGSPDPADKVWRFRVEFPAHALWFVKQPVDPSAIREPRPRF